MRARKTFPFNQRIGFGALLPIAGLCLGFRDAFACSCGQLTLEHRYEISANVFTAIITDQYIDPIDELRPVRSLFKVTESFKGGRPFAAFASHPYDATCGIKLEQGVEYLFFAPDSGEIGLCSGVSRTDVATQEIAAIRSYLSGDHADLSEPWRFHGDDTGCGLSTFFDLGDRAGHGNLTASASHQRAVLFRDNPDFDFAELAIDLRIGNRASSIETRSPLRLSIGSAAYKADWAPGRVIEAPNGIGEAVQIRLPDSYVMLGNDVLELVRQLTVADALLIQYDGQGYEPNIDIAVRTTNLADAGSQMLECIQNQRDQ